MIAGLFVDGWAHVNLPSLETFFTPWHGLLYSGFLAGAVWIVALAWRGRAAGGSWWAALPTGYRSGAVGVLLFGLGGVGDMVWHILFGVEVGVDALLSPTHLVILTGGALMLTAPLRSRWSGPAPIGPGLPGDLPVVLSLALVTALAAFFLLYTSVFTVPAAAQAYRRLPESTPGHELAERAATTGLAGYLVTTALLVLPLLLATLRGRRPAGTIVVVVAAVAWGSAVVGGFEVYEVAAALAVTLAAIVAEFVVAGIERMRPGRLVRAAAVGAALPALLWPAQLIAVQATEGIRWSVELWAGVVALTVLEGVTLGVLMAWSGRDAPPEGSGG